MKIYTKPGVVENYTPTGDGSSAENLHDFPNLNPGSAGTVTVNSGYLPSTFSSDTEQTKDGMSRMMLKIQTRIPRAVLDQWMTMATSYKVPLMKKDLLPSAHLVLSNYADLVRMATAELPSGATALDALGIGQLIAWQVRSLVAVCFGRSLPDDWKVVPLSGTVMRGLLGLEPVDVVNGVYGSETASTDVNS